jgi:hypothetical protein
VLAHGLREPVGQWDALHAAGGWVGRWKFLDGWTKVWSCERHADELVGAQRYGAAQTTRREG